MIHETYSPAELASHQHRQHAKSDCGHYDSPRLKHSHSLLRSFSLRSRNNFSLRKSSPQIRVPPLASTPGNATASTDSGSSHTNSSSVWKKWRVKCITNFSTFGQDRDPAVHDTMSCPQGSARKRILPLVAVSRLVAPFQFPSSSSSSSSDDLPCVSIPQSQSIPPTRQGSAHLDAIQDEDDSRVNGVSNPSSCIGDTNGFVELIRQMKGWVDGELPTQSQMKVNFKTESGSKLSIPDTGPLLPSPPLPSSSPPFTTPSSSSSSSPISPLMSQPISQPSSSPSSSSPSMDSGLQPLPFTSTPETNLQPSSNTDLRRSISQKRRAKFTLGDESDMDCDPLAISVPTSSALAKAGNALSSLNLESGADPVLLPTQTTVPTTIRRPPLTRQASFERESRDQVGIISTSDPVTATSMTNGKSVRRWTLSSALTDEDISDEGLVKELERMRKILEWDCIVEGHDIFPSASPPPTPANPWLVTQRALLTTRELILTERHYLSSLLLLLCPGSTLTPVPEMMVSYVKELVGVSERLLKGMEGEPSVRGVAEVFVEVGGVDGAESAFVGWCGVVGEWFQDDLADTQAANVKRKRKRIASTVGGGEEHPLMIQEHEDSGPGLGATATDEHTHTRPLMRNVSTWRKSMPSIAGLGEGGVWRKDRDKDRDKDEGESTCGRGRMSPTLDAAQSSSLKSSSVSKPIRKPAVRDLAILPTQRVMRYVLLYRDLLANTPPLSSSYPIIERAVEAASRIAEKCDQAQGNAAFIAGGSTRDSSSGSSSSGSSTPMLNSSSRQVNGKRMKTMPEPSMKLKSGWGSTTQSSSPTSSPTKSHFFLSSSPMSTSPSISSDLPRSSSLSSKKPISSPSPLPASSTRKNRSMTNPLPLPLSPPPPTSFNSKIPIARSGRSSGSVSTSSTGSSTTTTPGSTFSPSDSTSSSPFSSSLASTPPPLCLTKSTSFSSNISSRIPKPLAAV